MTAVVAVQVVAISTGRWRSTEHSRALSSFLCVEFLAYTKFARPNQRIYSDMMRPDIVMIINMWSMALLHENENLVLDNLTIPAMTTRLAERVESCPRSGRSTRRCFARARYRLSG